MRTSKPVRVAQYAALSGFVVFLGFPLLWLFSTAFKSPAEILRLNPTVFPTDWTLSNFAAALRQNQLLPALRNSLVVAVSTAVITTVIALPAAYALARYRSRVRTVSVAWILVSQVFLFILIVIPVFIVLRNFGLIDTLVGLVIVYVVWSLPFTLWMLQGYVSAIPNDLEEAAATDGASQIAVLVDDHLPVAGPRPGRYLDVRFISAWNEFFFALVLIQSPSKQTAPLLLARYVGAEGSVKLGRWPPPHCSPRCPA